MNLLVSVIIPSYNRSDTVGYTIDSIVAQKRNFDLEIIIGDDCSTDNVRNILLQYKDTYPELINLIFHKENHGLGANWAICLKACRGKYVANCDNDDYWHNIEKLQSQVDYLEEHLECGMVHTDYRTLNRNTRNIKDFVISNVSYSESLIWTIFTGKFKCCNSSVVYRKEVLDKYLNLDDYLNKKFPLQDWNTWVSIAKFTKFHCLPISTTTVGVETESITRSRDFQTTISRFEKEKIMYKYLCDLYPEDLPYDEKGYDSYVNSVLLALAYKKRDYKNAKVYGYRNKSLKGKCSQNKLFFYMYSVLSRIKNMYK
jgi:glycosyltransferase involved in cell wall biosynthesis